MFDQLCSYSAQSLFMVYRLKRKLQIAAMALGQKVKVNYTYNLS